ncbi:MAG TPA: hypothetical protein VMA09_20690 [Candidatus Binataceae bacterium]|nr:hypothetical protein [Candidatus Binataceae bacterium]
MRSVAEHHAAGGRADDLRWDIAHKFVALVNPPIASRVALPVGVACVKP